MSVATSEATAPRVKFARRSRRGVMLGMSGLQLTVVGVAVSAMILGLWVAGVVGLIGAAPVWGTALISLIPVRGRSIITWMPIVGHFAARRATGQTEYRRGTDTRLEPAGVLALPGEAASLRVHVDDRGTAMVHDPHAGTLTAILRVRHHAFMLVDEDVQTRRANAWSQVLASFCTGARHISRVQVIERTVPESSEVGVSYWERFGVRDGSWASRSYEELLRTARPDQVRHETLISIGLDLRAAGPSSKRHGRGLTGAAAVLQGRMDALVRRLGPAEVEVEGWLGPDDLAVLLRTAYDPSAAPRLSASPVGRDLNWAGPLAIAEEWDRVRVDGSHHVVLEVTEWPRIAVTAGFVWPVVLSAGLARTWSMTFAPVETRKAIRQIHGERIALQSDRRRRAEHDMVDDIGLRVEQADLEAREADLVAGHGTMRFAGLLVVSAATADALDDAVARLEELAAQASMEVRPLYGEQAAGLAAGALPLGRGIK